MRAVLDTNQASHVVHSRHRQNGSTQQADVVIPPYVWAEILLAPEYRRQERVGALMEIDLRFGMDVPYVYAELSRLSENDIPSFDPVFPSGSREHEILLESFRDPSERHFGRARELKADAMQHARVLKDRRAQYKRDDHFAKSSGITPSYESKFSSIDDADTQFISGSNAPFRETVLQSIDHDGNREITARSHESLFNAILANKQLRRFLRLSLTFSLGYVNYWDDARINRLDPAETRNDLTDISIALYAEDGDWILTEDRFLRQAFQFLDPNGQVKTGTWEAFLDRNSLE